MFIESLPGSAKDGLLGSFNVTVCRWNGAGRGPPEKLRRKEEEALRSAVNGPAGPSGGVRGARDKMVLIDSEDEFGREEEEDDDDGEDKPLGRRWVRSGAGDMPEAAGTVSGSSA